MREQRFISRKSSVFALILLTCPLISTGCGTRSVWGVPIDELQGRLSKGDYSSLAGVDFGKQSPSEALDLGPSAPYYLSFIFDALDKPDAARSMLSLAWERSPSPWREQAGLALGERLMREKEYAKAAETARVLVPLLRDAGDSAKAKRLLAEALYWGKDDVNALAALQGVPEDAEVILFKAVCSERLQLPSARGLFVALFLNQRLSPVHARAYLFLSADKEAFASFSDLERSLFLAKYSFQQGEWVKGIPIMEDVISRIDPALLASSPIVSELGSAYLNGGLASQGAAFMEKLSGRIQGAPQLDAREAEGKCARRVQNYGMALTAFRALAEKSERPERQDLARWFILDILVKTAPADLMEQISRESALWHDSSYFTDILQDEISDLVSGRKWDSLARLWTALGDRAPRQIKAQLSYILARALQRGAIAGIQGAPQTGAADLLRDALHASPNGYFGVLAAGILGVLPAAVLSSPAARQGSPRLDPLADGFISFGLTSEAYGRVSGGLDGMDDVTIFAYASRFAGAGDYRSSLNLMGALAARRDLSDDEMRLLYPRAFASLIEGAAERSSFQRSFLYGLTREESYFDKDIVSAAGAVGLAQLMPPTAADAAARLKMTSPDLTDPQTSITLGVSHLENLFSRTGSLAKALLAYNAGLSRSRSWDPLGNGLPLDLFIEAVPYDESRQYVRKILVSTVVYAYLYEKRDPRETLKLFYPDLTG